MLVADTQKHRIIRAYKIFKRLMKRHGRSVSFPKNTDPTKTYSWRYLSKFIDDYDKLELDDGEFPAIMEAVILDAKKRGLLNCGIAILNKSDLLAVSNNKFECDVSDERQSVSNISKAHIFLMKRLEEERGKDQHYTLFKLLSYRPSKRAYANITRWFSSGDLPIGYIAVSKTCKCVLDSIHSDELTLFPKVRQFISIRLRLISRKTVLHKLRLIFGDDLFEE